MTKAKKSLRAEGGMPEHPKSSVRAITKPAQTYRDVDPGEELELVRRCKAGDMVAGSALLKMHEGLLFGAARYYSRRAPNMLEDLLQEARLGFMRGIELFDESKGVKLTTYANNWVRQHCRRYLANQRTAVRIPVHGRDRAFRLRKSKGELSTEEQFLLAADAGELSLDAPMVDEAHRPVSFLDFLTDAHDMEEDIERREWRAKIKVILDQAMGRLDQRSRVILRARFEHDDMTLQDIGNMYGLSRERVRQIQSSALNRMMKALLNMDGGREIVKLFEVA